MTPSHASAIVKFDRRGLMIGGGAALVAGAALASTPMFDDLERSIGGRLGVFAFEPDGRRTVAHRAAERFPMCSSFKSLLATAVLEEADRGEVRLDQRVAYAAADLLNYAPVTRAHQAEGSMSVADLCKAAVEVSDNTAANLLLALIGGPKALTARLRAWGDPTTRLDRNEPTLNSSTPGDPRDTTTPEAMARTLHQILQGQILKPENRARLKGWMVDCQTGLTKLRAGLPTGGIIGDKTGSNGADTEGDTGFIEIGGRTVFMAVYLTGSKVAQTAQDAAIAEVARRIASLYGLSAHG